MAVSSDCLVMPTASCWRMMSLVVVVAVGLVAGIGPGWPGAGGAVKMGGVPAGVAAPAVGGGGKLRMHCW